MFVSQEWERKVNITSIWIFALLVKYIRLNYIILLILSHSLFKTMVIFCFNFYYICCPQFPQGHCKYRKWKPSLVHTFNKQLIHLWKVSKEFIRNIDNIYYYHFTTRGLWDLGKNSRLLGPSVSFSGKWMDYTRTQKAFFNFHKRHITNQN